MAAPATCSATIAAGNLPSDLSRCTTDDINILIDRMIVDYNDSAGAFTTSAYRTYVTTLLNGLQSMVSSNPATALQNTNDALYNLEGEIIKAKEDLQIAQDRVQSLRESNKQSYYESWFPINRPLRGSTNTILLGIGIFFFVFTFFVILHSMGFALNMNILWAENGFEGNPVVDKLRILFPFGIIPTLIILALIVGIIIVINLKKV
jgi:hypothetical protein